MDVGAGSTTERSASARQAMLDALAAANAVSDPAVLTAMGRVPREVFVPRFLSPASSLRSDALAEESEWREHDSEHGRDELQLIYDIDRALVVRRDPNARVGAPGAGVTSTASAPRMVGAMLELLHLAPGMHVLEIGTGSGYNAALLRELVGPGGSVTSVDIDGELVVEAAERLTAAGYDDIHVAVADGYVGLAERAPYDRVIATVGCVDMAPAWLDQLAANGFCLLPLQHGQWHPLTRIEPSAGEIAGVVVGRSQFVVIQGHQAGRSPWRQANGLGPGPEKAWMPLQNELVGDLQPEPGRKAIGARRMWDLAYLLALEDRRTALLLGLAEEGSTASVDPVNGSVGWTGTRGPGLRDRLLEVADLWIALGRPSVRDYASAFAPLSGVPSQDVGASTGEARWVVDRVDFRQTVSLRRTQP